ncbi:MAG: aminopeptidase [Phycisphaerales bacterium]
MREPRLDGLAEVVVGHCARVGVGDLVTVVGPPGALPAVEAIYEAVLARWGHPSFHVKVESLQEITLRCGDEVQARHVCPFEAFRLERCDVLIVIICPENTRHLGAIDPARVAAQQGARKALISRSMKRGAEGRMRYVLTEYPGVAAAQDAGMSLHEYAEFVYRAGFLDQPDPVLAAGRLRAGHERMVAVLGRARELHFHAPAGREGPGGEAHEGTDLRVNVTGRRWIECSGGTNFPDGEVFTGPVDAEGVMSVPGTVHYKGQSLAGIRLRFRGGRVVDAAARVNEAYLIALLDQDEGARCAGEVALGTNYALTRFVQNAFFDEKIGGTFHIGLGAGYPESGNVTESGLHWDLVVDLRNGGTVHADGELVQENGRFVREGWPGR